MSTIDKAGEKYCVGQYFIIFTLPFLYLFLLISGYLGILPINVEVHTLFIVFMIFFAFSLFIKHNANYSACHMQNTYGRMEMELQKALDDNALTINKETKSTLKIRDFIAEYYKDIRNDNFAKVASSVFPMLGILGTFVAIALSMPNFTVNDLNSLDKEITILLSGVGTAFYASIYGIFLSLLWTYFEKRGLSKVDKHIYELEKIYSKKIWKKSELIKHEHTFSALKDQEIMKTLRETFNIDFIKELNEQYMKNYKTIIDDTTNSFAILSENMQIASKELRDTLTLIQSREESVNAVAHIKSNLEEFNIATDKLHQSLEKFDGSVEITFEKIDSEVGEIVEKLSDFAFMLSEQNREIQRRLQLEQQRTKIPRSVR